MPGYVTLGTDVETGQPIWIGDIQRCGGVYLLGRARTGKSNSLISMALQDIERGIGLVFIDPHADAIQATLDRLPGNRIEDVILLDPTDKDYSFGINPLYCANPHNLQERQLTFGQTWDVFAKVFAEADERLGILLSKYLGNCLYPLIEHQGYTLYDLWYFLTNETFRENVLSTVTYHPEVVEFWHDAYDQMLPRDKKEEPASLLNRIDSLRRNPYIKYVISHPRPTIDFVEVMEQKKIVLLRLPPWQDSESRTFIGTLVISQLLKAIFLRAEVAEHLRTPFAIYCDEFQLFATPDFAKLFTQTGKYRIMPTVGHQDRVGQFKPNDPNRGATLAAPVKMLFRTSVPDSMEIAPELAKDSPTETKRERLLVISQNPVEDILRGHANPTIQGFVREYLRSLSHRLEDTEAAKEGERIRRQQYLDSAALSRALAQRYKDDLSKPAYWSREAVQASQSSAVELLQGAQGQNAKLLELFQSTQALRQVMRNLDSFLTAIMEGRIAKGQEVYARFLRELLSVFFPISPSLALYIALEYGESSISRSIPFELARRHGLYRDEVALLAQQAEERTNRERQEYWEPKHAEKEAEIAKEQRERREKIYKDKVTLPQLAEHRLFHHEGGVRASVPLTAFWNLEYLYSAFVWLDSHPHLLPIMAPITSQLDLIPAERLRTIHAIVDNPADDSKSYDLRWLRECLRYGRREIIRKFLLCVQTCPGMHAIAALLQVAMHDWNWWSVRPYMSNDGYQNMCMLDLPQIPGADPIEMIRVIQKINEVILGALTDTQTFADRIAHYFDRKPGSLAKLSMRLSYDRRKQQPTPDPQLDVFYLTRLDHGGIDRSCYQKPKKLQISDLIKRFESTSFINLGDYYPPRLIHIKDTLQRQWPWKQFVERSPHAAQVWNRCDELERSYLIARAYDLYFYGQRVADATFPQPHLLDASEAVAALTKEVADIAVEGPLRDKEQYSAEFDRRITKLYHEPFIARIAYSPPDMLPVRALSATEQTALKNACLRELDGSHALQACTDFVQFCDLLARPENHVQIPSTQYIETQVNTYTTQEMINQAAKELTRLPRGTAYATVLQEVNDTQIVRIVKIQTARIAEAHTLTGVGEIVKQNAIRQKILRKRSDIDHAIIMRQAMRGRGMDNDSSPPRDVAGDKPPALTSGRPTRKSVPPPATHYIPSHISKQQ